MLARFLRILMFFALIGGLVTMTPMVASADEGASARGKRKKKKKKKKVRVKVRKKAKKKKKKVRVKVSKKGKKAKKGKTYGAHFQACSRTCKKKGKDASMEGPCVQKCATGAKGAKPKSCRVKCKKIKNKKRRTACMKRCTRKPKAQKRVKKRKKFFADIFMPGSMKKSKVEYEIRNKMAVTDGDIILGDPNTLERRYGKIRVPGKVRKSLNKKKGSRGGSVITRTDYLWPNATIPYIIGSSVRNNQNSADGITKIRDAAEHISRKTILQLDEISDPSEAENYIEFMWSDDPDFCGSSLGMQGGRQTIVCNFTRSDIGKGTVVHEILHAAGFNHTQKRTDRDQYITINPNNSCPGQMEMARNHYSAYCDGEGARDTNGAYDIGSILHYGSNQCRVEDSNGNILPGRRGFSMTDKAGNEVVRQREKLSDPDIRMINEVYSKLPETSTTEIALACAWQGKIIAGKRVVGPDGNYQDHEATDPGKAKKKKRRKVTKAQKACAKKCGKPNPITKKGRAALKCLKACRK